MSAYIGRSNLRPRSHYGKQDAAAAAAASRLTLPPGHTTKISLMRSRSSHRQRPHFLLEMSNISGIWCLGAGNSNLQVQIFLVAKIFLPEFVCVPRQDGSKEERDCDCHCCYVVVTRARKTCGHEEEGRASQ